MLAYYKATGDVRRELFKAMRKERAKEAKKKKANKERKKELRVHGS
jgi:hypothetical protein